MRSSKAGLCEPAETIVTVSYVNSQKTRPTQSALELLFGVFFLFADRYLPNFFGYVRLAA